MSKPWLGKKFSDEHKKKIGNGIKKFIEKNGHWSKGKPSWNKGKKLNDETKKRISQARKGKNLGNTFRKGFASWNKGKKYPQVSGENHWNWKGGWTRSKNAYNSFEYRSWRMAVFTRDEFRCQGCGIVGTYITAHHIKSWAKYPKLRFEVNNGVTLCEECHKATDNYKGRKSKKDSLK